MKQPLSRIVRWSHELLREVILPGDCAVDLTAGNGYDTLVLAQAVGSAGQVLAFDLQAQALETSAARLAEAGTEVRLIEGGPGLLENGVSLVQGSHSGLADWALAPRAIIANLGYLPGGDKQVVTRPDSTLAALRAGCEKLAGGGRMAIVVYHGHPGGQEEAQAVDAFFASLPEDQFEVLRLGVVNRPQAPFLLVAGKLKR